MDALFERTPIPGEPAGSLKTRWKLDDGEEIKEHAEHVLREIPYIKRIEDFVAMMNDGLALTQQQQNKAIGL